MRVYGNVAERGETEFPRRVYIADADVAVFQSRVQSQHPDIPIYIVGVNTGLAESAGELCEGFHVHPFHTARYILEIVEPGSHRVRKPRTVRGRTEQLSSVIFVATNDDERRAACQQISFYASPCMYKTVLYLHGWGEVNQKLGVLAARGRWDEMPASITDEILNEVAIIAPPEKVAAVRSSSGTTVCSTESRSTHHLLRRNRRCWVRRVVTAFKQ